MSLSVQPVRSRRDWSDFFGLRRLIYKHDPGMVYPLASIERAMIDPKRHPFYQHAEFKAFNCYRGKTAVGRIAAIQDHLHNDHYQDRLGFMGFFESTDDLDVAKSLMDVASNWLRDRGCDRVRGPMNPSMKSEFGILVEGFGIPPAVMMSYSPPYYDKLVTDCGFEKSMDFFAYLFDRDDEHQRQVFEDQQESLDNAARKIYDRYPELEVRGCRKHELGVVLSEINQLANSVRHDEWGFVPMTDAELKYSAHQVQRVIRPDMVLTVHWSGRLVGYCVSIPDVNMALYRTWGKSDLVRLPQFLYQLRKIDRTRLVAVGVDPEFRKRGAAPLLSIEMIRRGLPATKLSKWEFSWICENNIKSIRNMQRAIPVKKYKVYRLYDKAL